MKYLKYLKYILKHKYYVAVECFKMGLIWRGLVHDLSKLRLSEFGAYANYFYGNYPDELTNYEKTYYWTLPTKKTIYDYNTRQKQAIRRKNSFNR